MSFLVIKKHSSGICSVRLEPTLQVINCLPVPIHIQLPKNLGPKGEPLTVYPKKPFTTYKIDPLKEELVMRFRVPGFLWS